MLGAALGRLHEVTVWPQLPLVLLLHGGELPLERASLFLRLVDGALRGLTLGRCGPKLGTLVGHYLLEVALYVETMREDAPALVERVLGRFQLGARFCMLAGGTAHRGNGADAGPERSDRRLLTPPGVAFAVLCRGLVCHGCSSRSRLTS